MKKSTVLRTIVALVVIALISVGFVTNGSFGTLSAIGWSGISLLCPLGALTAMLASKTIIPRAVISLVIVGVLIFLLGRAFCGWICPIPLLQRIKAAFSKKDTKATPGQAAESSTLETQPAATSDDSYEIKIVATQEPLAEKAHCSNNCAACGKKPATVDSRHFVLGGALLSSAIFGFPVFCLVCPIGLTFATIFLVILLFTGGDVTWSLIFVPLVLIAEIFLFKKWCTKLCPLSALMSLIAKGNRTLQPTIDDSKCLETSQGKTCGACGRACDEGIDLRHPELSTASMSECTRCRACVDVCPTKAISMPLTTKKKVNSDEVQPT